MEFEAKLRGYVRIKLGEFLTERTHLHPLEVEKEMWIDSIVDQIMGSFNDNDIYYDNMPEDVLEDQGGD